MVRYSFSRLTAILAVAFSGTAVTLGSAEACTRALYTGDDNLVITGRSMDWMQDPSTKLWVFPRGMERNGAAGPDSPTWTSRYGSLVASFYDEVTVDGMNEKGLVANHLYLAESDYGGLEGKPPMSIALWTQYILDHYATVAEAVEALEKEPFRLLTKALPNGSAASGHMALSDPTGDSAILEYLDGELTIHHGKQYNVMTNSPPFDQQLALVDYWNSVGGEAFLPGTHRAADRFVRTHYQLQGLPTSASKDIISAVPDQSYVNQARAEVLSLIRSVSVPLGVSTPGAPNIASTLWRTVADQTNLRWYYDSSTSPNTFWVDLTALEFGPKASAKVLDMTGGQVFSGEVSAEFVDAPEFQWLEVLPKDAANLQPTKPASASASAPDSPASQGPKAG